ncbi:MAG: fumarylacetoacetate hydrolase family protein [Deltaproteobacteria bacterium]|nr:fumarylacetoacetate hydrolase family protein [Deltaproteobacteria bacterium]
MRLYLGCLESSRLQHCRIFGDQEDGLVDLNTAYAAYQVYARGEPAHAYELADVYFPSTISALLERGNASLQALAELSDFLARENRKLLRGPSGERIFYNPNEVRILPPITSPEKTLIPGFSDQVEDPGVKIRSRMPTAFFKLPSTFALPGEPIKCPEFSRELDAGACLGVVIGKAGRRIPPERAWEHVGGCLLLLDITARDISRRESLTRNTLLGKNFPSSTSLGPALLLGASREAVMELEVKLAVNGEVRQSFKLEDLLLSVEEVISHWSTLELSPGDIIALGPGLALKSSPPQVPAAIEPGSAIRCLCPEIGELNHSVINEPKEGRVS